MIRLYVVHQIEPKTRIIFTTPVSHSHHLEPAAVIGGSTLICLVDHHSHLCRQFSFSHQRKAHNALLQSQMFDELRSFQIVESTSLGK